MTEGLTGSLSVVDVPGVGIDRLIEAPELYLVMQADAPLQPSLRLPLWALDRIELGRSPCDQVQTTISNRVLRLLLPDRRMSSRHAVIEVKGASRDEVWVSDSGSKNGTYLNGKPQRASQLSDGDVIELGHSFLLFAGPGPRWADLDLRPRVLQGPSLATFDPLLAQAYAAVADVASTDIGILITGDSGTGKEILARAIHALSRRKGPFVVLDPAAAASQAADQVLLGRTTDGVDDGSGLVDAAANGTLFLDEMSDLPPAWQLALVRVLQERSVTSLATQDSRPVSFRPVGTSHRSLDDEVHNGRFRVDLLGRIAGVRVHLPTLRERKQDIGLLIRGILAGTSDRPGSVQLRRRTVLALLRYDWPYNVRELEAAVRHGLIRAKDDAMAVEHLPLALQSVIGPRSAGRPPVGPRSAAGRPPIGTTSPEPPSAPATNPSPATGETGASAPPAPSDPAAADHRPSALSDALAIRLLGPLEVRSADARLGLPPSKKVRALIAYLVATGRPHRRERLGAMFCELADQQRAALRWQLSKVRSVLNDGGIDRLLANRQEVSVLLDAVSVDYHEVRKGVRADLDATPTPTLDRWARLFRGRFIEGLTLPDCADFEAWRVAVEEECVVWRVNILRALLRRAETDPTVVLPHARDLVAIVPDDARVGVQVEALARRVRALQLGGD